MFTTACSLYCSFSTSLALSLSCMPDLLDPSRAVLVFFLLSSISCFATCPILYLSLSVPDYKYLLVLVGVEVIRCSISWVANTLILKLDLTYGNMPKIGFNLPGPFGSSHPEFMLADAVDAFYAVVRGQVSAYRLATSPGTRQEPYPIPIWLIGRPLEPSTIVRVCAII